MLLRGVILLICFIVGIKGECRFATQYFVDHDLHGVYPEGFCDGQFHYKCPLSKYRTYNGSCNNLDYPDWGMSSMPFQRVLPPAYEDGVDAMRYRSVTGAPLPKPRQVSVDLFFDDPKGDQSPLYTNLHMAFGQFLDHDMTLRNFGKNMTGCGTAYCMPKGECVPIKIPYGDPDFQEKQCLSFVRSKPVFCGHKREQTNEQTAYLDLSQVYGWNRDMVLSVRNLYKDRGQLMMRKHPFDYQLKNLLPKSDDPMCHEVNGEVKCFHAGDPRANAYIGLMSHHTIFNRAHNTIEEKLHYLNPHWCGEKLFQETRKILSAIWQRIVLYEYVPLVIGPEAMYKYDLTLEEGWKYWKGYNPEMRADILNVFTTAAYRFGHSKIPNKQRFTDPIFHDFKEEFIAHHMQRPGAMYATNLMGPSGVDAILRGMADEPAYTVNLHYAKQMTVNMFTDYPPFGEGSDLAALDVQRGRDHGLKSYNNWRRFCGLKTGFDFMDMPDIPFVNRKQLAKVYKHVEDIDLIAGALAEEHVFGSQVGPTMNCLISKQFKKLRAGDRFWHENPDQMAGFTPDQLKEIRKYTLSYLICENGDKIKKLQPNPFLQPLSKVPPLIQKKYGKLISWLYRRGPNEYVSCQDLYIPDLTAWKDGNTGHGCGEWGY